MADVDITTPEQLDNRIELEKDLIEVPEKTVEASRRRASNLALRLAGIKKCLSSVQMAKLNRLARQLKADMLSTGAIDSDDEDELVVTITSDPQECSQEFDNFSEACQTASRKLQAKRRIASHKLRLLARKVMACRGNEVSAKKVSAAVRRIFADVKDYQNNKGIIRTKYNKNLKMALDWDEIEKIYPQIKKNSQLKDLTVGQLNDLLCLIDGGKGLRENPNEN